MFGKGADIPELYRRHADDLLVFLVRRTADVEIALDLWAETFAIAIEGARRYRGKTDAEAAGWLWGIARNQLALYYRRGKAERAAINRLGLEPPEVDPAVEEQITRRAELESLRRELGQAIAELSDETRAAIEMRVVQELPYATVAARLEISEPAARARVSRGLQALGAALDHLEIKEAIQS
jgi:RNA polymerase sigma-70 factor (ECF subfamily)